MVRIADKISKKQSQWKQSSYILRSIKIPSSLIFLIAMFIVSAIYMFPRSSTVRPFGWFILASLSLPSTCPEYPSEDPAISLGRLSAFHQAISVNNKKLYAPPLPHDLIEILQEKAKRSKRSERKNLSIWIVISCLRKTKRI